MTIASMEPADFLSLPEVKRFVSYTKVGTADDEVLESCAAAACDWVEAECGPQSPRTVVETVWSSGGYAALTFPPSSLTEATAGGVASDVSGWSIIQSGIVGAVPSGYVQVTYVTGPDQTPAWAKQAALHIARQLWTSQLRATGGNAQQPGFLVPNIAEALVAPHRLGPRP